MAQPKGKTGNPNGRPKGTPNRCTSETREWIAKLIDDNRNQIKRDLKALEPKERLQILEKFMQYSVPKMQNVEAKINFEQLTDTQLDIIVSELTKNVE